jgi:hypothetical protein
VSSFTRWDSDAYRRRVGAQEADPRRHAIIAKQWECQISENRKRPDSPLGELTVGPWQHGTGNADRTNMNGLATAS